MALQENHCRPLQPSGGLSLSMDRARFVSRFPPCRRAIVRSSHHPLPLPTHTLANHDMLHAPAQPTGTICSLKLYSKFHSTKKKKVQPHPPPHFKQQGALFWLFLEGCVLAEGKSGEFFIPEESESMKNKLKIGFQDYTEKPQSRINSKSYVFSPPK